MERPIVAIIGRPNVGKSRLFNRILGRRVAIVEDEAGVTRDRNYATCDYQGRRMTLVDTGGLDPTVQGGILVQVRDQSQRALQEADILILVMDGPEGITPVDQEILRLLRKTPKPAFYVINKIDSPGLEKYIYDFYRIGADRLYPVSAEHGHGVAELLDQIVKTLPPSETPQQIPEDLPRIAVVGRPNVGKSTLINRILGEDRLLTSDLPGTTRDSIDTLVEYKESRYVFIDTAGIRRRGRIHRGVEQFSVKRALQSLERCDLALVLLDGSEGIVEQDTKIIGRTLELGKGCIILVNKWDLRRNHKGAKEKYQSELGRRLPFSTYVPSLFISARTGKTIPQIFARIDWVMMSYHRRISTADLNRFFESITKHHPPPVYKGRRVRLYYITQASTQPPLFVTFANQPAGVSPAYRRYLENQLRSTFGFEGVPIQIRVRKRQ